MSRRLTCTPRCLVRPRDLTHSSMAHHVFTAISFDKVTRKMVISINRQMIVVRCVGKIKRRNKTSTGRNDWAKISGHNFCRRWSGKMHLDSTILVSFKPFKAIALQSLSKFKKKCVETNRTATAGSRLKCFVIFKNVTRSRFGSGAIFSIKASTWHKRTL